MHNICVCISAEYEFLDSCKYFLVLIHQKKKTHPKKQKTKENTPITWKRKCYLHFQENCLFEGRVTDQFDKSASAFNIYEQITNLDVWIEILIYLLQKKISICNKTGGGFSPTLRK